MSGSSKFNFTAEVKRAVGARNFFRCAVCNKQLGDGNTKTLTNVHHVIAAQAGDVSNEEHLRFLKSADNGVLLCDASADEPSRKDHCHAEVGHGGGSFAGFMADPKEFPNSHHSRDDHKKWVARVEKWRKGNL